VDVPDVPAQFADIAHIAVETAALLPETGRAIFTRDLVEDGRVDFALAGDDDACHRRL